MSIHLSIDNLVQLRKIKRLSKFAIYLKTNPKYTLGRLRAELKKAKVFIDIKEVFSISLDFNSKGEPTLSIEYILRDDSIGECLVSYKISKDNYLIHVVEHGHNEGGEKS